MDIASELQTYNCTILPLTAVHRSSVVRQAQGDQKQVHTDGQEGMYNRHSRELRIE